MLILPYIFVIHLTMAKLVCQSHWRHTSSLVNHPTYQHRFEVACSSRVIPSYVLGCNIGRQIKWRDNFQQRIYMIPPHGTRFGLSTGFANWCEYEIKGSNITTSNCWQWHGGGVKGWVGEVQIKYEQELELKA